MKSVVNDYVSEYEANRDYVVNGMGYRNPKVDDSGYHHVVDPGHIDTSIGYLYNTNTQPGKIAYTNVTPNVFQKDANGAYSYNSYNNFAKLNTSTKRFTVEDKAGGGFFPYDNVSTDTMKCNHYFGLHFRVAFNAAILPT